jgi:type II secretory pathway pseudopilin PulG
MRLQRARGYTFTEVLFAVILLGVGFIMLAGIFPVAIRQSQTSADETTSAAIARLATDTLQNVLNQSNTPVTGNEFRALPTATLNQVRQNQVLSTDRRFAWVPIYRRLAGANYAEVIVLAARVRTRDSYVRAPFLVAESPANTQALIEAEFTYDSGSGTSRVTLSNDPGVAAEDAYVIVATPDGTNTQFVGRAYRLGLNVGGSTWDLQPGAAYTGSSSMSCKVFILGRGVADPSQPYNVNTNPFIGLSQDIGIFTAIVPLR